MSENGQPHLGELPPGAASADTAKAQVVAPAGATAGGLCASFPNLRRLEPLPELPWAEIELPPLPPGALHGTLRNGLKYYVLPNKEPQNRAEVHLVVGFGSLIEEEDQRGGAHIIEHLGFSATKNYENHDIVRFLESIGATFGACQNAYTAFDRTVYHLHVATDDWSVVEKSLQVLREFAFWTRISEEDVERERCVVLDEWRQSKSAMGRLMESYWKAITKGSLYEVRLPIGVEEVIRGCPASRLRELYRLHYHPQRMAVVAVGDFDAEQLIKSVTELFDLPVEELGREVSAPPRPEPQVPAHSEPRFALSEDPELAMSVALIENLRPRRPPTRTVADFERLITERLLLKAINNRLYKVTMRRDSIIFQATMQLSVFCPVIEGLQVSISPAEGKITEAILVVLAEIERVKLFGLHEQEVHRAKLGMLAELEEAYIERNQTDSHVHASDFVNVYLEEVSMPGIEFESRITRAILEGGSIDAARVAAMSGDFDPWGNTVYKVCAPRRSSLFRRRPSLQEADLLSLLEQLRAMRGELEPWPEDADEVATRLQRRFVRAREEAAAAAGAEAGAGVDGPTDGAAVEVRQLLLGESFGQGDSAVAGLCAGQPLGEECRLGNGMRVFLRRNDIFDDEVLLRGECWGGLSEAMDTDSVLCEALNLTSVASELEAYGLRPEELTECLEGLRVSPPGLSVGCYRSQITGDSSPADLETLLLLLHLLFVCPIEPRPEYLETMMQMLLEQRLAEDRSPHHIYNKHCDKINTCNHPYYRSPSLQRLKRMDFAAACGIFNAKLSNPSAWTLVLVGKLPPTDELMALLETYVATIPAKRALPPGSHPAVQAMGRTYTSQTVTPLEVRFPSATVPWEEVHVAMVDPQCRVLLTSPLQLELATEDDPAKEGRQMMDLAQLWHLLETKLCERLRFQLGKTYKVSIGDSFDVSPPQLDVPKTGIVSISFGCELADAKVLLESVLAELQRLREQGFEEREVAAVREQERRSFEKALRENGFWENTVAHLYFSRSFPRIGGDLQKAVELWKASHDESLRKLSSETASAALQRALPYEGVHSVVVMVPQAPRAPRCALL